MKLTTNDAIPNIIRYESEKTFINPKSGEAEDFPFLEEKSSVTLSLVVPAYNEELRCKLNQNFYLGYCFKTISDCFILCF